MLKLQKVIISEPVTGSSTVGLSITFVAHASKVSPSLSEVRAGNECKQADSVFCGLKMAHRQIGIYK